MAIFRGVGGSGDSSDNSYLQEVTAQANAASASASAASASASAASASASSILNLTAATGAAGTEASYDASTGVLTVPRGADGSDASVTAANVTGVLTGGTGISIASNGTITNDSPDQTVALTGTGATTVTGTYPNFTIDSTNTTYTVGDGGLTTNDFTDADHTKLDGIETGADVTDTANVTSAGALMDSEVTNLAQVKAFDSSDYATATQGTTADNALPKAGGQMTGNITFSGTQTVDGRDLSVDGSKLDNLLYSRTSDAHLHFFTSTALTTTAKTFGKCFSLATPFDCVRFADVEFELTYNSSTSNNDILVSLGLVVPSGTHTVHNLGTATQITDSDYPNGYADRWFSVDGDKSHLFSSFCGVADSSTPSSPTYANAWVYRADLDETYFNAGIFSFNGISDGDTVYLHPFDWESTGTVIQETYNMDSVTAYGGQSETKGFRVKTAYDDSRLEYRVIAREASSTDTASIKNITVLMTDYEV
jgi:hypothetical protein